MSRYVPYLGVVATIVIFFALVAPTRNLRTVAPAAVVSTATSSGPSASTTTAPAVPRAVIPAQKASTPVPLPRPTPAQAAALRAALVNIICLVPKSSGLHSISASGVIVSSSGIILTNAHVAQYYLLADRGVLCDIRTGSPAQSAYHATLAYISPAWVRANATILTQEVPNGTGERDFAFLAIDKSAQASTTLPITFPFVSLASVAPIVHTPVAIASYGAQFLDASQIESSLFPTLVFGNVKDVFTFGDNTPDVFAVSGSIAAQEGSSGGGVIDASGALVGTIATSAIDGPTNTRTFTAITASYIRSAYLDETGESLNHFLATPTSTLISDFAPLIPALESILTEHLR